MRTSDSNQLESKPVNSKNAVLSGVSGSSLFKNQLINYFIPRIEAMAELEKAHLHCLIDMNVPNDFINRSQETHLHLVGKVKEYKEYAEGL